ncbi:alpha/beta hydrolase [Longimicrobium sp.]|uniref:alpha/beta hydrolase n=1 Tax=Longimicrobium sp. TaxID=2029185 RepID=UPI002E2EDE52|nr:alpha/beta hydrolase [Longimicrobium sp.]HEX6042423.1 alpha/beta hydrolase [Longimicrobium sp.]
MPDRPLRLAERIEQMAARVLVRLPGPWHVRLSGEPPVTADGLTFDPHAQLVRALRRKRGHPGLCLPTLQAGRARYRRESLLFRGPVTPVGSVHDFTLPGPGGPLAVRHYAPAASGPQPLTVYLHGGGFTIGDLDTHDEACRILCAEGHIHVLSVDYRLAPEHPFPAALDDARAALRWAQAHAAELGADPARVAIGGDSAGGNLAAVVSIQARDEAPPFAQLLIYPATDARNERPSVRMFGEGYFLDRADRAAFTGYYLDGTGVDERDWRVAPLYANDLSGLAPALVVIAGFDMLRDEGEAYALALRAAGTSVALSRVDAHGHGFLHMTGVSPGARQSMVKIARDWRTILDQARQADRLMRMSASGLGGMRIGLG